MYSKALHILVTFIIFPLYLISQCGPATPTFSVNLTGNPNGTWLSPNVSRNDVCCGQSGVNCIKFIVTLDPDAAGIIFGIASGPGAASSFYQVTCGPQIAVGSAVCLSGVGPHIITFCKPGNNANTFSITSIPTDVAGIDISVNNGCVKNINATGLTPASVTWNSIFPGASGAYNNYLSCTSGCLTPTITPIGSPPPYVDYVVCGQPTALCNFNAICDTVRITFNPTLALNIVPINPTICFGQTSTSITAVGSGGSPPYSYLWNNVNPSQTINVGVGTYNVQLSDASGCPPIFNSVTVTGFTVAISSKAGPDQIKCNQSPIATLNGTVTGATSGIWSGGTGTYSPNNTTLSNLTYSPTAAELTSGSVNLFLTTTGSGSCPSKTDTVKITYVGFTGVVTPSITNVSCFGGSTGSSTMNISGGFTPYTYLWNTVPSQTTSTASNLSLGIYSVTIRDGLGCTYPTTVNITQPPLLTINASVSNVSCFGTSTGSIALTPAGGTLPYSYTWSPGGQTTSSVTGLPIGNYSVTVKDANNCVKTATYTVTQPSTISITYTQTNVSCFNGSDGTVNTTITGGTSPYTFNWNPGGATTQNVTGLQAGTHTITVTDNLGCIKTSTVAITQPTVLVASATATNETCNYLNNGSATASQTGGTAGYTYSWQPGGQTTASISNQASGSYTVTVTDSKGCTSSAIATITEPVVLTVNFINQINVSCFGGSNGSVVASPSGGTTNYTYIWSPGGSTNATLSNIPIGTYTVTVNDSKSCVATNTVVITQPTDIVTTSTITNVSCNGGSNGTIALTPTGGVAPYTYLWALGGQTTFSVSGLAVGIHTVNVKDANNCQKTYTYTVTQPSTISITYTQTNVSCFNGSDGTVNTTITGGTSPYTFNWNPGGATTQNVTGLQAGTHTITVTDNLGCIKTSTVAITQPTVLVASATATNETCNYLNNGSATASQTGGTAGYTYSWQPGGQTTASIFNQASGSYTVTVTDTKGCTSSAIATITEPIVLTVNFINQINVSCFGGSDASIGASPSGGTTNYTYTWSPGGTTNATLSNIPIGTYTVTVNDSKSCVATNTVVITQPTDIVTTSTITNVSCNGGSNGTIAVTPSGGVAPYTYLWALGGQTTFSVSGLAVGIHTVTVKDANNCQKTYTYTVTQPSTISITYTQTNVSCFNGSDGTVNTTITGGTSPYTYSWNPGGATTQNVTGLQAGTHTITVTDNLGCIKTSTVAITQPTVLVASATATNETCNYLNNGSATASQTGGTAGYTYSWQLGGQTTASISNQASGSYTVTVTDTKGCTSSAIATITEPVVLTVNFINQINVSCFGGNNGSIVASPSGGTTNYTYTWSPGGTTNATLSNIPIGTYTVTVNDSKSCVATNTVVITQPTDIVTSSTVTNVSCNGGSNGTIAVTPTGGVAPYTYLWALGGQTTFSVSGLAVGIHTVNVKDANNCQKTYTYTVTQPSTISITYTQTNVSCFNGSDGTVNTTITGGTSPYTYSWNPGGATTQNVIGLQAGTHTITVTDNLGCIKTSTVAITQPTVLVASATATNETCNYLNNGSATASQTGGTAGYTYLWQPGGQTTASISNQASGSYTVTVTDTKGCTSSAIATITEPIVLTVNFINQINVSCFGGSNGSVVASPSGGTTNYTYVWSPGGTTNATLSNIPIGTYTVTVNDSKSCVATNTVVITQPTDIVTTSTITNVSCNGGSNGTIAVTPTGGVAPYTYLWALGGQTTFSVSGLAVGNHIVTVKDANNCQKTYTYTVTQPSTISITYTQTNVSCFNGSDGTVNTTITGGTSPYTYSWNPGGATTQNVTGLQAGTHTITVTDNLGCIKTSTVAITQPVVLVASATATNETCNYLNNGSATTSQTGGTAGYTYSWQPGGQTTASISNQASGSYTVTVTDTKGCTSSAIATITEPIVLTVNFINQINVSCFGGSDASIGASPSGGTTNYTYTWSPGGTTNATLSNIPIGTYTVTVNDSKSCVATNTVVITQPTDIVTTSTITNVSCNGGSNGTIAVTPTGGVAPYTYLWTLGGQTTFSVSGLAVGIHTVNVKDANNCQKTYTYTVTQPSTISITYTQTNVSCFNGSDGTVNTTITGGTSPYTFNWNPGGATTQNVTGLQAGTHTITVTDNLGCIKTSTVAITQPTVLVASATATNETCNYLNNGSATASQTGGTAGYTYLWQPGGQTTASIFNQASGSYTVTVTDTKGCTSSAIATITEPVVLTVNFINQINVSCFGGSDASIGASPSGGTTNYTYAWSPGGTTNATLSNIPIGTYTVTVNDSKSCVATNTVVITQPTDIVTTSTITNVSCNGGSNGTIAVTPTGGVAPYTYLWALGGQTTFSVSGLAVGNHIVTVKDANNCQKTYTYTVTQPSTISITYTQTNVSCFNGSDGTVNTAITGGTSPYTFNWNPGGATTQNVTGLPAGTHTITVTDNLGCIKTSTVAITQPTVLVASATATNETCNYLNNGSATASQTGGTAGYTYSWQPGGQTTASISNQASGSYTVTVTDTKGCTSSAIATITEPIVLTINFINQINVSCFGGSDASIGASPSGGTPNYSYSWTPGGATTNALFNISAGIYTITITDDNNCILENTVAITQPTAALYVTPSSTQTSCFDGSDGSAMAQAFEGTSTYSYNWMPGNISGQSYLNLISGIYTVTATDFNGCTATNTVLVDQPSEILPVTTSTNSTCGNANGIGSVSVTGGLSPYTYQWLPSGGTGIVETGLISASYTVVVTDANGCTGSNFLDVSDSGGPIASIVTSTNVSCFGGSDGAVTANVTGGFGLLTYSWSPSGGNALTANGLTAGTYFITIIDANGCQSIATTDPEITEPTQLFSTITTSDVSCFAGANGSATVTAGGGIPAYSYSWLPGATTGSVVAGLSSGIFTVQITDANLCVHTATYAITQPTAALVAAATSNSVSCFAGNNGSVNVNASGGTSPYNYNWMPGNFSGQSISNLIAGTYTATVTDINNCSTSTTVTVIEPTPIVLTTGSINSDCGAANGQASVSATGGMGAYTYSWIPGGGTATSAIGLLAGTYTVEVTDANSCMTSTSQVVGDNPGPSVSVVSTTSVTCFGGSDAIATAGVTGGTGPFTYTWSPIGGNGASTTGIPIGTYTVNITSANGCLASAISSTIIQPTQLFSSITTSDVSCFAGTNGSATVTAGGGIPAYSYSWLPGATTGSVVAGLSSGIFTVQITDANLCVHTATYAITQPTAALVAAATSNSVSCFAGNNGSVNVNASGGTSPYNYNWMPGNFSGQSISNLIAGTYTATVTDINNCSTSTTVTVIEPTPIVLTTGSINSDCGAANGQASVSATGGMGAYTYSWIPGGGTATSAIGLLAGTYTVEVTDANSCMTSTSQVVGDNPGPSVSVVSTTSVTCFGGSDAIATAGVTGGTGPFTYTWSPIGGNGASTTGIPIGTYTVNITSANGCLASAISSTIIQPTQLFSSITTSDVSCFAGTNGSATVTAGGGIPAYSYSWLPGATTGSVVAGLSSGIFTVQITDANLCVHTATYAITQPTAALVAAATSNSVSCFAGNNGSVNVNASGGTSPYNYNWMPGNFSGQSISNLIAGTYTATVTDINNCSTSTTVTVIEPTPIVLTTGSINSDCGAANGQASVSATGGMGAYTYSWMPNGGTTTSASGLLAGTYTVEVTDANSCMTSTSQVVGDNPGPSVSVVSTTSVTCFGGSDAIATAGVTGGTGPFTYTWSPIGGNGASTTGIPIGTYTVNITSANGCLASAISSTIIQPTQLFSSITTSDVSCFAGTNGSATVTAGGGIPAYSYSWLPGATTGSVVAGLSSGIFTVQITDANLCVHTATYAITQPTAALVAAATSNSVSCFAGNNGSVNVNASGGTSPYNYNWMPGNFSGQSISNLIAGTYTATVTDINNCSTSTTVTVIEPTPIVLTTGSINSDCGAANGQASVSATGGMGAYTYSWIPGGGTATSAIGLLAGTYTVEVTDANSCMTSTSQVVGDNPGPSVSVVSTTSVTCFGGSDAIATAGVTGGTGPFTYTWSPIGGNGASTTGIPIGTYTVNITSANGCLASAISSTIIQPTQLFSSITTSDVSCFAGTNGSATVTAGGGIPAYSYSWLPGATTGSVVAGLSSGIFTVQITDANLCVHTATYAITQPTAALVAAATSNSVSCFAGNNGSVNVNASGGTSPYNYNWMPGNFSGQSISNLIAGTYTATVTDINNCSTSTTVTVIEPTPIVLTTGSINSDCGAANGQASVSATGGMGAYTYSWIPGGGTATSAIGLLAGTYTVEVTDANSCMTSTSQVVGDNPGPSVSVVSTTSVTCFGGSDAIATAGVTGGTGPFTYTWSPIGGNGASTTGIPIGTYTVNITSANGCLASAISSTIIQPTQLFSSITTSDVSCFAGTNGSATVTAGGGIPAYSYSWLPGATTGSVVAGLSSGIFTVQITDANLCVHTATYAITQPTAALVAAATSNSVSCFAGNNGSVNVNASGGTSPYNYNWMPGNFSGQSISNLIAGTYTATVTDINNCSTSTTVTVIEPTPIVLTTGSINSDCGAANGQASVSATGGMGAYTYSWMPNGGTTTSASGLLAGTYTVEVTDANSCMTSTSQVVGDNPGPSVSVVSTTSVTCFGGSDAIATAGVTGGTGPFTYTWSPIGGNGASTTGIPIGTYTVNITSANGCLASAISSTIIQPTQLFSSITTSDVSCFAGTNGSATVTAGGGIPAYSYSWLPGATTGSVVAGLSSGIFTVQITDANLCVHTATYAITQPTAALAAAATSNSVSCFGGNNGSVSVNASGGTVPYNYNWMPMSVNSQTIGGLAIGVYTVNIIDLKNCTTSTTVMVTEPTQSLSATAGGISTSCSGGSDGTATVTPTGGTGSYSYSWSPTGGSAQAASGLTPGNYFITVSDANNCQTTISVFISSPTAITGNLTPINAACGLANGSISSQITGGTGPYTYSWSPVALTTPTVNGLLPGTYTLNVTDFLGCIKTLTTTLINIPGPTLSLITTINDSCFGSGKGLATINISQGNIPYTINWLPYGGNTITASQLTAGIYTANVTDDRGCLSSITATITEPNPVSVSIDTIINVSCFNGNNGSISVTASGGTPTYSYSWSPSGSGQTINNLTAGSYIVNVMDSYFCPSSISINVSQPTILTSTINIVSTPLCFNGTGSSFVSVSGGTIPYTYTWTTSPPQNGSMAMNLGDGTYTVFITDANNCKDTNLVTITQPLQIVTIAGLNDTICLNQTGVVTATATGGVGNYYYAWQPFGVINYGTLNINPATATTNYTVIAYDQNGCAGNPDNVQAVVYSLTDANIQTIGYTPICPGQGTTIYAVESGDTGPLTYNWNNNLGTGPGAFVTIPTQPTTYIVTITNSCGASLIDSVRILFNPPPTIAATSSGTLICVPGSINFSDNSISGNINDPITNWSWSFGDNTTSSLQNPIHTYTTPGTYFTNVTVTTNGGCTNNNFSSPIIVKAYPYPVAAFSVNSTTLNLPYDVLHCTNNSTGASYYNWNFGDGNTSTSVNPNYLYSTIGAYEIQLIATSQFGCSDTASVNIITDADVVFPNAFSPNTDGPSGGYYITNNLNNDIFFPFTSGVFEYKLQIFNRWGELIFETDDIKQGWDGYYRGKICQTGVYIWKAHVKLNNGKVFNKASDVTIFK